MQLEEESGRADEDWAKFHAHFAFAIERDVRVTAVKRGSGAVQCRRA
jgi:hypothetical protein